MSVVKRIILIDDDPVVHKICNHLIKRNFSAIEFCSFISPVAGLAFIKQEYKEHAVKAVLLLDINMPKLNGWEVLEELTCFTQLAKDCLTIYIFSSSVSYEDKTLSEQHPLVTAFLEKPLTKEMLADIIDEKM